MSDAIYRRSGRGKLLSPESEDDPIALVEYSITVSQQWIDMTDKNGPDRLPSYQRIVGSLVCLDSPFVPTGHYTLQLEEGDWLEIFVFRSNGSVSDFRARGEFTPQRKIAS